MSDHSRGKYIYIVHSTSRLGEEIYLKDEIFRWRGNKNSLRAMTPQCTPLNINEWLRQ